MNKQVISQTELQKKVEIEAQYLIYMNHMRSDKAFEQAKQEVLEKYTAQ